MIETRLWNHLRPELNRHGKFQKVSDRYTSGIPDVLGCFVGTGIALELKELKGIHRVKLKFRPGQLDWLEDWEEKGKGKSWIMSSKGSEVFVHHYSWGWDISEGMPLPEFRAKASLIKTTNWSEFCKAFLTLD